MRRRIHWLAGLRRWRRRVSLAVLPAFVWYGVSATACFGMPVDGSAERHATAVPEHAQHAASAHSMHDSAAVHDHEGMPNCPHCPAPVNDDEPAGVPCISEGTPNANGPKASAAPDVFKLFAVMRLTTLPTTAVPPPLIRTVAPGDSPRVERTPLNIRHCVFLI